jgi:hypothetical protein
MSRVTPDATTRLAEVIEAMQKAYPDMALVDIVEMSLDYAAATLVDGIGTADQDELDKALREWLSNTRPPSGAFGQSMEATMAYHATRNLWSVAARHLAQKDV